MEEMSDSQLLFSKAFEIAPRILGHQDRNILSPTYGIFGRKYWGWKMAAIPDASNQYAIYYLALLWMTEVRENVFYHSERLLEWISAGIKIWCKLQNHDGSFDQVFLNEHSVGTTSYTLLAILETDKILGDYLSSGVRSLMSASIEKAGKFLLNNDETYGTISNHSALFAVTFNELWNVTQNKAYKEKCEKQIIVILENMSKEGWFKEYEGADPGYMTQCMYYLVKLLKAGRSILEKPIETAIKEYLSYFIHPDGSLGGCYGSRGTVIFYPAGIALLSKKYMEARRTLECMCWGINRGNSPSPASLDLPNAFRLAANYILAWQYLKNYQEELTGETDYLLPWEKDSLYKKFPEAGVVVVGTVDYYSVFGTKKGGVLKAFDKKSRCLVCEDRGYIASMGRESIATYVFNDNINVEYKDNSVKLTQPFFIVQLSRMSFVKYWLLLFFGMTFFHLRFFREKFKQLMVKYLITGKRPTIGRYQRQLIFSDLEIRIKDIIFPQENKYMYNLRREVNISTIHMACADYFDLSCMGGNNSIAVPKINKEIFLDYTVSFPFNKGNVICGVERN